MKVLLASSEALPFFKSGGLADVARSLPDALRARGHDVRIIHPLYQGIADRLPLVEHEKLLVPWVGGHIEARTFLHEPSRGAPAVLVHHHAFGTRGSMRRRAGSHSFHAPCCIMRAVGEPTSST
jgi:starch synthase